MRSSYEELLRENRKLKKENQELRARLAGLQRENQALKAKLKQLEAELRRGRRQAAPFSKDDPNPKRPGRRPGRGRFTHRKPPPEEEIQETHAVPLDTCPNCGGLLQERRWHEQIQIDLPPVEPVVIRFRTQSGYCPRCGKRAHSRGPPKYLRRPGRRG